MFGIDKRCWICWDGGVCRSRRLQVAAHRGDGFFVYGFFFMPFYENVFVLRQDLSASQAEVLLNEFGEIAMQGGGKVCKREFWGLRTLAYKIGKNRKGYYCLLGLDAPFEAVQEMERLQRLSEDVIRYLTTKVKVLDLEPSPIVRFREDRIKRGGESGRFSGGDRPFASRGSFSRDSASRGGVSGSGVSTSPDSPREGSAKQDEGAA